MIGKQSVQTQSRVIRPFNLISQTVVCAHLSQLSAACSFSVISLNRLIWSFSCDKKLGFIPRFHTENKELDSDFLLFASLALWIIKKVPEASISSILFLTTDVFKVSWNISKHSGEIFQSAGSPRPCFYLADALNCYTAGITKIKLTNYPQLYLFGYFYSECFFIEYEEKKSPNMLQSEIQIVQLSGYSISWQVPETCISFFLHLPEKIIVKECFFRCHHCIYEWCYFSSPEGISRNWQVFASRTFFSSYNHYEQRGLRQPGLEHRPEVVLMELVIDLRVFPVLNSYLHLSW